MVKLVLVIVKLCLLAATMIKRLFLYLRSLPTDFPLKTKETTMGVFTPGNLPRP